MLALALLFATACFPQMCGRELQSIKAGPEELRVLAVLPGCGPRHDLRQNAAPDPAACGEKTPRLMLGVRRHLPLRLGSTGSPCAPGDPPAIPGGLPANRGELPSLG